MKYLFLASTAIIMALVLADIARADVPNYNRIDVLACGQTNENQNESICLAQSQKGSKYLVIQNRKNPPVYIRVKGKERKDTIRIIVRYTGLVAQKRSQSSNYEEVLYRFDHILNPAAGQSTLSVNGKVVRTVNELEPQMHTM